MKKYTTATVGIYKAGHHDRHIHVKNLGWLLAHASEAYEVSVAIAADGDVWLTVYGRFAREHASEWNYLTRFADLGICLDWLTRPSLAHTKRYVQTVYGLARIY